MILIKHKEKTNTHRWLLKLVNLSREYKQKANGYYLG